MGDETPNPRGEARNKIGSYEIVAPIGAGGMGEVYRARDLKLDREVALKVLPQRFVSDPHRMARFEREAKVLASLNHPNIGHIYGLEEADGVKALVLELVEGPTLADRIAQGPIPFDEALPIARQIAEALEAAHARGVIHRDLKPANVKVKTDGTVKVLDFGLAKAFQPEAEELDPSASPTLTAATGMGVVLGTAAYMAPEQARGRPVDKRADVWAFGVVLFEMLSGMRPFAAEDVSGTLARVLEREPDWNALPPDLPPVLRSFLRRCLEKTPAKRIHDIADMRLAMEGAFDSGLSLQGLLAERSRVWQRPAIIALMVLAASVVGALLGWYARPGRGHRGVVRLTMPMPTNVTIVTSVEFHNLALSPDGRRLAFVGYSDDQRRLWLRSLDRDAVEPLAGTEGASSPFWSPDGRWLAYFTESHLWKLRPGVGRPESVCAAAGENTGTWGPDGTILFSQKFSERDGLYRLDPGSAQPQPISERSAGQRWPVFLPDGERFLFNAFSDPGEDTDLFAGNAVSGSTRLVSRLDSRVALVSGHLVYVEKGTLLARRFDPRQLRFTGDPIALGSGLPQFVTAWAPFSVSPAGVIAYGTRSDIARITLRDRNGRELASIGEPARYESMALSPDGSKLAVEIGDGSETDIWIHDIERGLRERLTSAEGLDSMPVWSPDGRRIVWLRHGSSQGGNGLYVRAAAGGEATRLELPYKLYNPSDWSKDGEWLVYSHETAGTQGDIWAFSMTEAGPPVALLQTGFDEWEGRFSPDGKWLAYSSDESGREEIYVAPVTGSERDVRVSTAGGWGVFWRGDGTELFYSTERQVLATPIRYENGKLVPGSPTELFAMDGELWGVTADGERFLVVEKSERDLTVRIILNLMDELATLN